MNSFNISARLFLFERGKSSERVEMAREVCSQSLFHLADYGRNAPNSILNKRFCGIPTYLLFFH